jgi:hypothetical protein
MAMMRTNPLPIGKYWQDVFAEKQAAFRAWLTKNKATVHVDTTESTSVEGTDKDAQGNPARDWYLFTVSSPTKWEGPGYPTIATPDVKSSADTVTRPAPEIDPLDKLSLGLGDLGAVGGTVGKVAMGTVVVGVLALAGWFAVSSFAKQRSAHRE